MCPNRNILEQLTLGLLSHEEFGPLEVHLAACERCLQTLRELNPADTLIEALRQAPHTAARRASLEEDIERVQAAVAARSWGGLSVWSAGEADAPARTNAYEPQAGMSHFDDTSSSAMNAFSIVTPPPEPRTQQDDDEARFDFLAPAQSPDELGRLGNYRVLRVLGTGGMGVVFEAEDVQLKRHVALKAMTPGLAARSSARKRFVREAQAAAAVEHDHIVPIYQVGEDRGVPFIAMPLLRGETLADRLASVQGSGFGVHGNRLTAGPTARADLSVEANPKSNLEAPQSSALPVDEVLRIGREIALGLAAAHARGLIHRDIKPSNVWLEEETGRAKILDFGLARAADAAEQLTQAGATLGTPAYMSPEQARGERLDARADLFSLGCLLYHMATGRRPFSGRDSLSTLLAVTTADPPAPRELNPELAVELSDLIVALLSKTPSGRPPTAREVADALASVRRARGEVPAVGAALLPLPLGQGRGEGGTSPSAASHQETAPIRGATSPQPDAADNLAMTDGSGTPPRWRFGLVCAAGAAAVVLAGVLIVIKDREGKVVATVQTKDRADVTVDSEYTAEVKPSPAESPELTGRPTPRARLDAARQPGADGVWPADAPPPAIAPFDEEQASQHQQAWADYVKLPLEYTNSVGMKFVLIPPGEFAMGSTREETEETLKQVDPNDKNWQECTRSEAPRHKVVLTRPFYIAIHEVTQKEYEAVMGTNPSYFAKTGPWEQQRKLVGDLDTANFPVEGVNWSDAAGFCAKLSTQEGLKPFYFRAGETVTAGNGTGYRLPTEAEWEFACRAGTTTRFWNGDESPAGWFGGNSGGHTREVAELVSNPFGLYDVHGNVWEWVEDSWEPKFYDRFAERPAIDPKCPFSAGAPRMIRGGCWFDIASNCRSAFRLASDSFRNHFIGFRVVLVAMPARGSR